MGRDDETSVATRGDTGLASTLLRAIDILELLSARSPNAMTVAEVSAGLGLHRSITYRVLRSLESRSLVRRVGAGVYTLGFGLTALARNVALDLQAVGSQELRLLADTLGMTVFISVEDGEDCVTLVSAEPSRHELAVVSKLGTRHSLRAGSSGRALLSLRDEAVESEPRIADIRAIGYAESYGEILPGTGSVSVAISLVRHPPIAIGAIFLGDVEVPRVAAALNRSAAAIAARLH